MTLVIIPVFAIFLAALREKNCSQFYDLLNHLSMRSANNKIRDGLGVDRQ
jgi:hypothetical protein